MFIIIYLKKRTVDITKKWVGMMSLKHMQRTCATESKSLAQLSSDTHTHTHTHKHAPPKLMKMCWRF
jgi:hypothetical protein